MEEIKKKKFKSTKAKKFYIILSMLLILLIPIAFLTGIVNGRENYKAEAIENITKAWAQSQIIEAPSLTVIANGKDHVLKLNNYNANIKVNTEMRRKGIFSVPVYTANIELKGDFINDLGAINNLKSNLSFNVTDSKGFIEQPQFKILDNDLTFGNDLTFSSNITTKDKYIPFLISYKLRGLNEIFVSPKGLNNKIAIEGNWKNPGFEGDFLPTQRNITGNNFNAQWSIPAIAGSSIKNPTLGVTFLMPVDNYRMATRAVKYAFLFLTLTFVAYFIYEITSAKENPIHQLQYLMMGAALLIFYLLLVSMSEFIPFTLAYILATLLTIGLISSYTYFVITKKQNLNFTTLMTAILLLLYVFLYVLLMLQDLSLIIGSIGLFLIIALVMYSTRNVEWYSDDN